MCGEAYSSAWMLWWGKSSKPFNMQALVRIETAGLGSWLSGKSACHIRVRVWTWIPINHILPQHWGSEACESEGCTVQAVWWNGLDGDTTSKPRKKWGLSEDSVVKSSHWILFPELLSGRPLTLAPCRAPTHWPLQVLVPTQTCIAIKNEHKNTF